MDRDPDLARRRYAARMERVLDHVDAHPDGELSVAALAGIAAFSPFHFHRQFAAWFGIGVARYVALARMRRAGHRLAFRADSVTDIALDAGYAPEAFARAFRRRLGQSPSAFRARPDWTRWHAEQAPLQTMRGDAMRFDPATVEIVDFPATRVALLEHRGDPATIGDSIRRFIAFRRREGLPPATSATFNILHTDPQAVTPEDYRIDLACAIRGAVPDNPEGIVEGLIPAGRCARLRQTGAPDDLRPAIAFLYGEWLPASGEEARDAPPFAQRVRFFPDVPEREAVTDLFLPLR